MNDDVFTWYLKRTFVVLHTKNYSGFLGTLKSEGNSSSYETDTSSSQPFKINLNKKLDSKQKISQIFNIDAQGFWKTKNENPPTWEIKVTS